VLSFFSPENSKDSYEGWEQRFGSNYHPLQCFGDLHHEEPNEQDW
jgi:hypothetical protein